MVYGGALSGCRCKGPQAELRVTACGGQELLGVAPVGLGENPQGPPSL